MPKNKVSDPITDQEMAFARLVLSGSMTDQQAAAAVGLNPATAAYIKSKPCVRAYMLEHRAAVEQQLVQQEAEALRRRSLRREQVLDRLWELAGMSSEMTRGSITGQVKALSMIVAIEGLIPDRRARSAANNPAPLPTKAYIDPSAWRREEHDQEDEDVQEAQAEVDLPGTGFDPGESTFADPFSLSETQSAPPAAFAPDTRVPFSINKNLFSRRR